MLIAAAAGVSFTTRWLRSGIRMRRRYRRRPANELAPELPTLVPWKDKILGPLALITGSITLILYSLGAGFVVLFMVVFTLNHGQFPRWLAWAESADLPKDWNEIRDHPTVEFFWGIVELGTIIAFGWMALRFGMVKIWPHRATPRRKASFVAGVDAPPSPALVFSKLVLGGIALLFAGLGSLALRQCVTRYQGNLPTWLPRSITGADFRDCCQTLYQSGWDFASFTQALFFFAACLLGIKFVRSGMAAFRGLARMRKIERATEESKGAAATQPAS